MVTFVGRRDEVLLGKSTLIRSFVGREGRPGVGGACRQHARRRSWENRL